MNQALPKKQINHCKRKLNETIFVSKTSFSILRFHATAPQQLNACWGDFPGKFPPTKRKILDHAG